MGSWTLPHAGHSSGARSLSTGQFPTMGHTGADAKAVPVTNGTAVARKGGKGEDPTIRDAGHRRAVALNPASETYGPAGRVQVFRSVSDPTAAATGNRVYRLPSAFGEQEPFAGGRATGYKDA